MRARDDSPMLYKTPQRESRNSKERIFFHNGKLFNELPLNIRKSETLQFFKRELNKHLQNAYILGLMTLSSFNF